MNAYAWPLHRRPKAVVLKNLLLGAQEDFIFCEISDYLTFFHHYNSMRQSDGWMYIIVTQWPIGEKYMSGVHMTFVLLSCV